MKDLTSPNATVDPWPRLESREKQTLVISATTVMRRREPTNPQTASHVPNFVFDHSKQSPVLPDRDPRIITEATHTTGPEGRGSAYRTMNRSGKPFALGVSVGGSPDDYIAIPKVNERPGKKIIKG